MDIDKVNKWLVLLGNLGVVAGIIFLAIEVQQNTNMMRAQTRHAMTENQTNFYERFIDNRDIAELWFKAGESFSEIERPSADMTQVAFLTLHQLRMWEDEWYQYQQGLFEAEEFDVRLQTWETNMNRASHRLIWSTSSGAFAPGFRNMIDGIIRD